MLSTPIGKLYNKTEQVMASAVVTDTHGAFVPPAPRTPVYVACRVCLPTPTPSIRICMGTSRLSCDREPSCIFPFH
jgi:hypothetical protein